MTPNAAEHLPAAFQTHRPHTTTEKDLQNAICEAEPIPMGVGWYHVAITGGRVGQTRSFSKQQSEWLTINRQPAHVVPEQRGLFNP